MRVSFLLIAVLGTLALLNPDVDDFAYFIRERTTDVITDVGRAGGGSIFGALSGGLSGRVAELLTQRAVEHQNYFLLSLYTLDFDGPEHSGNEWTFLGIGGQFFEMQKPRILDY